MNPKLLLLSLLACLGNVSARAQEVAQPKPGTVVVEHGDDRITIEFGDAGKPKVTHNGNDVAADSRGRALDAYRYALKDYFLKVSPPKQANQPFLWGSNGTQQTDKGFDTFFAQPATAPRPHIGVQVGVVTEALAYQLGLDPQRCVLVMSVTEGGPAAKAGLCANDILLRVGDQERVDNTTLSTAVAACKAGDELEVEALQRGARKVLEIVVGEEKVDPGHAWFGVGHDAFQRYQGQTDRLFANGGWVGSDAFDRARNRGLDDKTVKAEDYRSLRDEVKQLRAEWERLRQQLERDAAKSDKRDR